MLTLSIQHNIYLTRDQRYSLHDGTEVNTIGVSLPIWHMNGKTSEPGREVFCKYYLRNPHKEIPIKIMKDGYVIFLPFRIPNQKDRKIISNEEWLVMTQEQREAHYTAKPKTMSSASLLDIVEGGSESLMYREQNRVKNVNQYMRIIHYINMFDMKYLEGSLYYEETSESEENKSDEESDGSTRTD